VQEFKSGGAPKKAGQLTGLMVYRLLRPNPAYEYLQQDSATQVAFDREYRHYSQVSVIARFNDAPGAFTQSVSCNDRDGGISCGVECDGGGFQARMEGGGLALSFREGGMAVRGGCGEEEETTRMLGNAAWPGPSRLEPRQPDVCARADQEAALSFTREKISLRERISTLGWTCLKRSYDKAHLKKNPKQQVESVAVAVALNIKPSEEGGSDATLDVTASIRTRDGKSAKRKLTCYPDQYQFTCEEEFRLRRRNGNSAHLVPGSYSPEPGAPRKMFGLVLGAGDDVFRLDASTATDCEAE
jgi:hypothetical protein